jgi:tetratricopeptide (TPR) repeat protein
LTLLVVLIVTLVAVGLWQLQRYWIRWCRSVIYASVAAFRRGDYEGQLREAERLKNWIPAEHLLFRGMALYELGRFKEAEESLRQSLPMRKDQQKRATCEGMLGMVLREQQRFEEAMACFESALGVKPQSGSLNREIAKTLLRQGTQPGEALRQARKALEIDQAHRSAKLNTTAPKLDAEIRDTALGESLSTLAWAEAVNSGSASEVERLLRESLDHCMENHVPAMAEFHYHAGRAWAAIGKTEPSIRELHLAVKLDSGGNTGRLARAAIPVE